MMNECRKGNEEILCSADMSVKRLLETGAWIRSFILS